MQEPLEADLAPVLQVTVVDGWRGIGSLLSIADLVDCIVCSIINQAYLVLL